MTRLMTIGLLAIATILGAPIAAQAAPPPAGPQPAAEALPPAGPGADLPTSVARAAPLATSRPSGPPPALRALVRNITKLHGTMTNQLSGTGLVVGLKGTGSGDRVTRQAMANILRRGDLNITDSDLTAGNYSLVSISADLPPFAREGHRLDVTVAMLGDGSSLFGGRLEYGFLKGPDQRVYATAAGNVSVGGISAGGGTNARVSVNHVNAGRVPNGALVIENVPTGYLSERGDLELRLLNPSFLTAESVARGINATLTDDGIRAGAIDPGLVRITIPEQMQADEGALIRLLNRVGEIPVAVENPSTVVIDETTGLVLAGAGVMISPCVVVMSDLTITVVSDDEISQPFPGFSQGSTERVVRTRIDVQTSDTEFQPVSGGATVNELLSNLKALALTPRQLVTVFQHLKAEGYLHAELKLR